MVNPVPGRSVTTAYGIRGRHWSCNRDSSGNGVHTGADFAAPHGTRVVAARPGTARHVNYGSAFGSRQLLIVTADGTADFYAHMSRRIPANGARVEAGQHVGDVGADGNATGPHLHFERHRNASGWNCSNHTDPGPSIRWAPPTTGADVSLTNDDVQRLWNADVVNSGLESNPTWRASTFLRRYRDTLFEVRDLLTEIRDLLRDRP
jgi:murein DD-endopeptidase MepM/ murein hydrolase activator NlpD